MRIQLMQRRWLLLGFVPLLLLGVGLGTALAAGLINGGFEEGTTNGWTETIPSGGSINVVGAADGNVPVEGSFFAHIKTNGPGSQTKLSQSVSVAAGDTVSGYAYFRDVEFEQNQSCGFDDTAEVTVDGNTVYLAHHCSPGGPGISDGTTPWTLWEYTFPGPGTFLIEATLMNVGDSIVDSFMGVDDVTLTVTAIGGLTIFSGGSGSSYGSIALLAGGVIAAVAIAASGGWLTRKRWLGSNS